MTDIPSAPSNRASPPNGRTHAHTNGSAGAWAPDPRTGSAPDPHAPATAPRLRSGLPSAAAIDLARATVPDLERAVVRGVTPPIDDLVGWEFRGINATPPGAPPIARLAGIQKFVKGMFATDDGGVMGYNCPVVQNALDGRWQTRPSDDAPKRFGFYTVAPVDPTRRDNHYLHALLLDYGRGGNRPWDITRGLRDYLVQIDADNPDLLIGKAYAAIGPARVPLGYFLLERWRRAPGEITRRRGL
jgi:hypothetical protein